MEEFSELKSARLLSIYARLLNGRVLKKALLAQEFGVTARSIQRDLESLRSFLSNEMLPQDVVYDRAAGGYRLTHAKPMGLSNSEILAVCKILLESRSMRRDEMLPILDKLVDCCVPEENNRAVQQMIGNEKLHYIEPHHGQPILRGLWGAGAGRAAAAGAGAGLSAAQGSRDSAPHSRAGRHPVFRVLFLSGRVSARRRPEAKL